MTLTRRPMTADELNARIPDLIEDYAKDLQRTGRFTGDGARDANDVDLAVPLEAAGEAFRQLS